MLSEQKGFTLVELLVVIAILGILAGTVTVAVVKHLDNAKVDATRNQIVIFKHALSAYYISVGNYPTTGDGLAALVTEPASIAGTNKWKSAFLDSEVIPKDPWGYDYDYKCPGEGVRPFEIISYGKDGQPGGEGLDADIASYNIQQQ